MPIERHDRRHDRSRPWGWVVFTDSFLSGWRGMDGSDIGLPDVSVYALAVSGPEEAAVVLANGRARSEMKRGRIVDGRRLPGRSRYGERVHVSMVDRGQAGAWYVPGAWR